MDRPRQKLLRSAITQRGVALDHRVRVQRQAGPESERQAGPESAGFLGRPPLRVLVVDDDTAIRDLVTAALLDEGYHVLAATNGAQALQRLQGFQPDVILLDIQMPEMDGPTFADRYRQTQGPHAPIVVFSAAGSLAKWTDRIGAAAAVDKVFDLSRLPDLLLSCVGQ